MKPHRFLLFIALSAAFLFYSAACTQKEVGYNSNSGLDGVRDTASQLYLNTSQDDRCNAEEGDNEDWRYMLIEEPGLLHVSVRVDNPRMEADLYLHDGFGRPVDRLNVTESSDFYEFDPLEVPVGRYYFRIACLKGQSVYTVSAAFDQPEVVAEPSTVYVVEPDPEPEPVKPRKRDKKEKKVEKKPKETAPVIKIAPPEPEPEPVVESDNPPKSVVGTITLVTPGDSGKAKVVIRGIGKKYGITKDMRGTLKGRGKKVSLFSCESTKCQGIVEADEEELKEYDKVEFLVPQ